MNVNTTGIAVGEGGIVTFCDIIRLVLFNVTSVNVLEPPGINGAESTSCVSLAWKDQVKLPAVDGEQILTPSFIVNVPLVENVMILSLKQVSAALLVTSVPLAVALRSVHDD